VHIGINELNNGYWPRPNLVTDENGDLLAASYSFFEQDEELVCVHY